MAEFEFLPPGVVDLDQPHSCIMQSGGHNPNPIQAKLHFGEPDPTIGILESDGERVLLLTADGPIELLNHHRTKFLAFAAEHSGRRCRFARSMLSFTEGPTPAISTTTPDKIRHCRPSWAEITYMAWRIGEPVSGAPATHQQWTIDLGWCGKGPNGIGGRLASAPLGVEGRAKRSPWAAGLAGKIADLAARGPHTVRLAGGSGTPDWTIHIEHDAVTAHRTDAARQGQADAISSDVAQVATLADIVHDSFPPVKRLTPDPIHVLISSKAPHTSKDANR